MSRYTLFVDEDGKSVAVNADFVTKVVELGSVLRWLGPDHQRTETELVLSRIHLSPSGSITVRSTFKDVLERLGKVE